MSNLNFFLNRPLQFKDLFKIYPPTINEVVDAVFFNEWVAILCITHEELELEFKDLTDDEGNNILPPTPFEYLLTTCFHNPDIEQIVKDGFYFFIHEKITFLYDNRTILIGDIEDEVVKINDLDELSFLEEKDYFDFQNIIRESLGREPVESPELLTELDPRIRKFKLKAKERDRVKAKQEAKNAPSLETMLASICCMGIGLNPLNIGEISYASMNKLIDTYQKHEKYDMDNLSLLMGADAKKIDYKYWIRNDL